MSTRNDKQSEVLVEAWRILRRYRWRFVLPAFLMAGAVLGVSLFLPRKYKAEATFERRTDMVLAEIINRGAPQALRDPKQSLTEEVAGPPAIDALVTRLTAEAATLTGLPAGRLAPERLRDEVMRRVTVSFDISTAELDRVRIGYLSDQPVLARAVANALVQNYLERMRTRIEARLRQSADFFRNEVQRNRTAIEDLENKKLAFEIQHAGLLPDQNGSGQTATLDLQERLLRARQDRDTLKLRVEALGKTLATTPATTPMVITSRNPDLDHTQTKLLDLQNQLAQLVGGQKMTAKHPDVIALKEQVALQEQKLAALPREIVTQTHTADNPKHAEIGLLLSTATAELTALESQVQGLSRQTEQQNAASAQLFPVRSEYLKLNRDVEETRRQLAFWEDNLRRVEMTMAAETGNRGVQLEFLKPCDPLTRPVSPDLTQVLAAAVALGLMAGVLAVFLAHRTDETFTSGAELARSFDLPMLGSVTEIISRRQRRLRSLRHLVLYPVQGLAMTAVLLALAGVLYLNLERPGVLTQLRQHPLQFVQQHLIGGGGAAATEAKAAPATE